MSAALEADLIGLGVLGPGLTGWPQAAAVLRGELALAPATTQLPPAALLPAAERRRTSRVVQLTLAVALEACNGVDVTRLPAVFASSGADGSNCHELLSTLATPERLVSPTRFTNSVHNVAAGYWGIATHDTAPYNVLCAYDGSFAAGLIEALCWIATHRQPVLLVAYDIDYPMPLRALRPIPDAFGVALRLGAPGSASALGTLRARLGPGHAQPLAHDALERLRASIPAARALPLLRHVAEAACGGVTIDYLDELALHVEYDPCR